MFIFTYSAILLSILFVGFAIFIFVKKRKDILALFLALCMTAGAVWIGSNAGADLATTSGVLIFWSGMAAIGTFFFLSFYLCFVETFAQEKKPSNSLLTLFLLPSVVLSFFAFSKYSIVETIFPPGAPAQIIPGIIYQIFPFLLFIGLIYGGVRLALAYKTSSKQRRRQIVYMEVGFLAIFFGLMIFIVILPLMGELRFFTVGPQFALFFILLSGYAIFKYRLLDIRILATQISVFVLWSILGWRIFVFQSVSEQALSVIIFALAVMLGVLLLRSSAGEIRAREQAQRLTKRLQNFISFATHELRAPISKFKSAMSLILEGDFGEISQELRGVLWEIYSNAEDMSQTVDTFLDYNQIKIDQFPIDKKSQNIVEVVAGVAQELGPLTRKGKIELFMNVPDAPLVVPFDIFSIKHVVRNVLSNAIKYNQEEGTIQVSVKEGDHQAIVEVKDTGRGMTAEQLKNAFNEYTFSKQKDGEEVYESHGIGMWLSKKIVALHGGTMWAESEGEGKGSTFTFTLPME